MQTIYGLHDAGGEQLMVNAGRRGWVVVTEAIGSNPHDRSGGDYRHLADQGMRVLVRLNNGYGADGTLPHASLYGSFGERCAAFVANTVGADHFIIANEPNHSQERPSGTPIQAHHYVMAFQLAREAIKERRRSAQVLTAAIAPWNVETGDWLLYFQTMLTLLVDTPPDGITLHAYTHGSDPALITSGATMQAPYENRLWHFRHYEQFLAVVPDSMRTLPVYITETNQGDQAWGDVNRGWVRTAYEEIDSWNRRPGKQRIECLCLYRWAQHDRWSIQDKPGVIDDFKQALQANYAAPTDVSPTAYGEGGFSTYIPLVVSGGLAGPPVPPSPPAEPPRDWDARLTARGVRIETPVLHAGEWYWRVVRGRWFDEQESGGRHHIYIDARSRDGVRQPGLRFEVHWPDGAAVVHTEVKPGEMWAANYPLSPSRNEFSVYPPGPGETVTGIGMGAATPDGGYNAGIHTSTGLAWELTQYAPEVQTPPEPAAEPPQPQPAPPSPSAILEPVTALAFLDVESGNAPFIDGLLTIRFEVHRFEAYLGNQALFDRHFRYVPGQYDQQFWRPTPNEPWRPAHGQMAKRHELLAFARTLDDTAALKATGMGMAQVMGANHARIGYRTPQSMLRAFGHPIYGVQAQLLGFVNFVLSDAELVQALRKRDWYGAVTRYNGEGQQAAYTALLEDALKRIKQALGMGEEA